MSSRANTWLPTVVFPKPSAGSWTGSEIAGTWIGTHFGYQHHRQWSRCQLHQSNIFISTSSISIELSADSYRRLWASDAYNIPRFWSVNANIMSDICKWVYLVSSRLPKSGILREWQSKLLLAESTIARVWRIRNLRLKWVLQYKRISCFAGFTLLLFSP